MPEPVAGLLLAAGAGRRFGGPKALVEYDGEPLVQRAVRNLAEAGCASVRVVLGAAAPQVRELLPPEAVPVLAEHWQDGMGESLKAGLESLTDEPAAAVLVHLVDLPWVPAAALARIAGAAADDAVVRAAYQGIPGHPVLFGRLWWAEIATSAHGDHGARDWLRGRADIRLIECGDLGSGSDVDRPGDLSGPGSGRR